MASSLHRLSLVDGSGAKTRAELGMSPRRPASRYASALTSNPQLDYAVCIDSPYLDYRLKEAMMFADLLLWGSLAGVVHFLVIGILYGNPVIDRLYRDETERSPAVKRWASKPR